MTEQRDSFQLFTNLSSSILLEIITSRTGNRIDSFLYGFRAVTKILKIFSSFASCFLFSMFPAEQCAALLSPLLCYAALSAVCCAVFGVGYGEYSAIIP